METLRESRLWHLSSLSDVSTDLYNSFRDAQLLCCLDQKGGGGEQGQEFPCCPFYHSGFHSRSQKTNERILPPSEYIHPNDILRDFLTAAHAKCEQRRSRVGNMGQRADISRCICMKLTGIWTGLVTVALARLTDK